MRATPHPGIRPGHYTMVPIAVTDSKENITCRLCGQEHCSIRLRSGERALCLRCGSALAQGSRLGPDAALVFAITGIVLAVPAALLPFVRAGKLGDERISLLFTGVGSLWEGGMRSLAVLVLLCGGLLPLAFLAVLAFLHLPSRPGADRRALFGAARILERWSIPEVQVLAVLVALMKLGSVVDVSVGPGFWFYCAMALSLLFAERTFNLGGTAQPPSSASSGAAPAR